MRFTDYSTLNLNENRRGNDLVDLEGIRLTSFGGQDNDENVSVSMDYRANYRDADKYKQGIRFTTGFVGKNVVPQEVRRSDDPLMHNAWANAVRIVLHERAEKARNDFQAVYNEDDQKACKEAVERCGGIGVRADGDFHKLRTLSSHSYDYNRARQEDYAKEVFAKANEYFAKNKEKLYYREVVRYFEEDIAKGLRVENNKLVSYVNDGALVLGTGMKAGDKTRNVPVSVNVFSGGVCSVSSEDLAYIVGDSARRLADHVLHRDTGTKMDDFYEVVPEAYKRKRAAAEQCYETGVRENIALCSDNGYVTVGHTRSHFMASKNGGILSEMLHEQLARDLETVKVVEVVNDNEKGRSVNFMGQPLLVKDMSGNSVQAFAHHSGSYDNGSAVLASSLVKNVEIGKEYRFWANMGDTPYDDKFMSEGQKITADQLYDRAVEQRGNSLRLSQINVRAKEALSKGQGLGEG